jgi:hypothetical protein
VRQGADEYAAGVLGSLEADITHTLSGITRGLQMLDERRAAYLEAQQPVPLDGGDDVDAPLAGYGDEELDAAEGASTAARR